MVGHLGHLTKPALNGLDAAGTGCVVLASYADSAGGPSTTPSAEASTPQPWHVLQVKPGRDDFVGRQVASGQAASGRTIPSGYRVLVLRRMAVNERFQRVRELLFPGYVLVQFEPIPDLWAPLHFVDGVVKLLSTPNHRPMPLPAGLVDRFVRECAKTESEPKPPEPFKVGDQVRVVDGPFGSFVAEVTALPARDRISVLLSIFGNSYVATMSFKRVEVA